LNWEVGIRKSEVEVGKERRWEGEKMRRWGRIGKWESFEVGSGNAEVGID